MYISLLYQVCLVSLFCAFVRCVEPPVIPNLDLLNIKPKIENLNRIALKGKPVPPCIACQNLVKSFLVAVEKTTRHGFSGGDADWEKLNLGAYENSELRFIEIQEMLCSDVELGRDQCYNLAEEYESELEVWFNENRKNNVDLHKSLCIEIIKVCCPNNTYGPNCIPCPGGVEKPCGGHGKCRRGGTREEFASCVCDAGYTGELCSECVKGYYSVLGSSELSCKKCDAACKDHCRGPGRSNCEVCALGYRFIPDKGCVGHSETEENGASNENHQDLKMSEIKKSNHLNISSDFADEGIGPLQVKSNIEDSTVNTPNSEL